MMAAVLSLDIVYIYIYMMFYKLALGSVSDKGKIYIHCRTHYQWTVEQSDVGYSISVKDNMENLVERNVHEAISSPLP
jgi:hypothetical protein